MKIIITKGKGSGDTQLSAFDKALFQAGIANFNLIYLSSIIPSRTEVTTEKIDLNNKKYGNKLYVVMARKDQTIFGKEAWAGIGWVQNENKQGVLVEHTSENKKDVRRLIRISLKDIIKYRKGSFKKPNSVIVGIECKKQPVSVIVAAVFKDEAWN